MSSEKTPFQKRMAHYGLVLVGALGSTFGFFVLLPLIQAITEQPEPDTLLHAVGAAEIPPPTPPEPENDPEPEKPEEEPPPQLEEAPPMDLSQLELMLNPEGFGSGWGANIDVKLASATSAQDAQKAISFTDLDQPPRPIHRPGPVTSSKLAAQIRKIGGGTVYIIFFVTPTGRVERARVQESSNPILNAPALAAVKKWKFQPGKRNGKPVRFRMRQPITFPKGGS